MHPHPHHAFGASPKHRIHLVIHVKQSEDDPSKEREAFRRQVIKVYRDENATREAPTMRFLPGIFLST